MHEDQSSAQASLIDSLWKNAPVFLLRIDQDGIIRRASAFAHRLTGTDLNGFNFTDILIDQYHELLTPEVLLNEPPNMLNVLARDGLAQTLYFTYGREGENVLAMGFTNPEEERTLRGEMTQINNELNTSVRELGRANHQFQEASEAKNVIINIASNDLRAPLTLVVRYYEELRDLLFSHEDENISAALAAIGNYTARMEKTLNLILEATRIESDYLKLNLIECDAALLMAKSISQNRFLANHKKIKLSYAPSKIPSIFLDQYRILQTLDTILIFMISFTPAGGTVSLSCTSGSDYVEYLFQADSTTLGPEDRGSIFDLYRNSAEEPQRRHSNLGLAVAKRIVRAHHGTLTVKTTEENALSLSLRLPHVQPTLHMDALQGSK